MLNGQIMNPMKVIRIQPITIEELDLSFNKLIKFPKQSLGLNKFNPLNLSNN